MRTFLLSSFLKKSDLGFRSKKVFFGVFGLYFTPGSEGPHIFADPDPDPGSQNPADPTDPDPKHWYYLICL